MKKLVIIFIIVVVVALAVFGIRNLFQSSSVPPAEDQTNTEPINQESRARNDCVISGCSGQICAEKKVASTCLFLPEHECYQNIVCERQANDQCGWTRTDEFMACLEATRK